MAATLDVLAESGAAGASHRVIAARAGVPLGSTTYYFATLPDLLRAALTQAARDWRAGLDAWAADLPQPPVPADPSDPAGPAGPAATEGLAAALEDLAHRCLRDRRRAVLEYELSLAAARDPVLRPLARSWRDGLRDLLAPLTGPARAAALAALVDGVLLQAVVAGEDVDVAALRAGVAAVLR